MKPTSPLDNPELLEVVRTARALVKAIEAATPHLDNACLIAQIHHCPYSGPTYVEELTAAKSALANLDRLP